MTALLTIEDIAQLWKVSREYARKRIVKLPEFPNPAPGSTRKNPRWREGEVRAFLFPAHESAHESQLPQ